VARSKADRFGPGDHTPKNPRRGERLAKLQIRKPRCARGAPGACFTSILPRPATRPVANGIDFANEYRPWDNKNTRPVVYRDSISRPEIAQGSHGEGGVVRAREPRPGRRRISITVVGLSPPTMPNPTASAIFDVRPIVMPVAKCCHCGETITHFTVRAWLTARRSRPGRLPAQAAVGARWGAVGRSGYQGRRPVNGIGGGEGSSRGGDRRNGLPEDATAIAHIRTSCAVSKAGRGRAFGRKAGRSECRRETTPPLRNVAVGVEVNGVARSTGGPFWWNATARAGMEIRWPSDERGRLALGVIDVETGTHTKGRGL